jgi:hypothetical protein
MTQPQDTKPDDPLTAHTATVIDEYLSVARWCVDTDRGGGAVWGYPAALLLFSATDAIGRGLLPAITGNDARLDVLAKPPFNLALTAEQVTLLRRAYRNPLSHNAQLGTGAVLGPDRSGPPFEFQPGDVVYIRLPPLCDLLERGWSQCRSSFAPPQGDKRQGKAVPTGVLVLDSRNAVIASNSPSTLIAFFPKSGE